MSSESRVSKGELSFCFWVPKGATGVQPIAKYRQRDSSHKSMVYGPLDQKKKQKKKKTRPRHRTQVILSVAGLGAGFRFACLSEPVKDQPICQIDMEKHIFFWSLLLFNLGFDFT